MINSRTYRLLECAKKQTSNVQVLESNFNRIKYDEQDSSSKVRAWLDKEFKGIKPTTPNHIFSPAKELDHEHCTTAILLDLDSHMLIDSNNFPTDIDDGLSKNEETNACMKNATNIGNCMNTETECDAIGTIEGTVQLPESHFPYEFEQNEFALVLDSNMDFEHTPQYTELFDNNIITESKSVAHHNNMEPITGKSICGSDEPTVDGEKPASLIEETINVLEESRNSEFEIIDDRKRSRWNKSRPDLWKKNKTKQLRSMCQDYPSRINKEDKILKGKKPKSVNCENCKYKCVEKFTDDERQQLCKMYWSLSFNRQKDFILSCVDANKATQRTNRIPKTARPRTLSNVYYFEKNMEKQRICQKFFMATLCISNGPIITAIKGKSVTGQFFNASDQRGKKINSLHNKTNIEDIDAIKSHINSFPVTESHYTRKSSKRHYLDEKLSIVKMYELFQQKYKLDYPQKSSIPSAIVYRQIFCTNFNLSFFKPKKDQCASCEKFKNSSDTEKLLLNENYNEHLERMHQSFIAKNIDNTIANISTNYVVASFDLQSTLQLPSSEVSLMFYSRKLNIFNLTIYESSTPNDAYCYTWTEVNGRRGSSEIGSCLLKWFQSLNNEVTEVTLYSDTCGGQNRNQNILALMLFIVQKTHIEKIEHKFMESGHSMMEVDSMHSAIEKSKKHVPVFTVQDWVTVFKTARSTRNRNKNKGPYTVTELGFQDFVNLQLLATTLVKNKNYCLSNEKLNWLKVKSFEFRKDSPFIVGYKNDYFDEYKYIDVRSTKGSRRSGGNISMDDIVLKQLYTKPLPISVEKKKDLINLCNKNVIPSIYHNFFFNLPSLSNKRADNIIAEADTDDEDENE